MTPKEKAQELFDKYFEVTNNYYQAKQCALIAVDEILSVIHPTPYNVYYWQEVKKEIEAL
jgi:hypothetical protein